MQTKFISIFKEQSAQSEGVQYKLSLENFIQQLRHKIATLPEEKTAIYVLVLEKIEAITVLHGPINFDNIQHYSSVLYYIFNLLKGNMEEEDAILWALGCPVHGSVFFATDSFYELMEKVNASNDDEQLKIEIASQELYALILSRLYDFPIVLPEPIYYTLQDVESGFPKHYQATVNSDFVTISSVAELPEIPFDLLKENGDFSKVNWNVLEHVLPLSKFKFEGFIVLTLKDVSMEYEMNKIKELAAVLPNGNQYNFTEKLDFAVRSLLRRSNVLFSILPLFKLNGFPILKSEFSKNSILFNILQTEQHACTRGNIQEFTQAYLKKPYPIVYKIINEISDTNSPIVDRIAFLGFTSYICVPLHYNNHLSGILEVYTKDGTRLDKHLLTKIKSLAIVLGQLTYDLSRSYEARMNAVILEKFTSLQPAVQWKFNEAAVQYLQDVEEAKSDKFIPLKSVQFKDVYPLYGAIDVRNSTAIRNKAVRKDLEVHLDLLDQLIKKLANWSPLLATDEILSAAAQWHTQLVNKDMDEIIVKITNFLEKDVPMFLDFFRNQGPRYEEAISEFEEQTNPEHGISSYQRRSYDNSLQLINNILASSLAEFHDEIQQIYPCYFEKFRTDGIEYDLYLGQSISPKIPFSSQKISEFRFMQLAAMAKIAQRCHKLLPTMQTPLETTQLIYLNPSTIDISFRHDERRFDVEGSYNIRYQVIKKRIDKICIKDSDERLTQPNTIAIVYYNSEAIKEYAAFIARLQRMQLITDQVEKLDLEEVQGVSGLKALRVHICQSL